MYKRKVNDLNSDGMDESPSDEIDEIELRNTILYYNHEYKRKLELGKAVRKIVIIDEVDEDELLPEHKEALDLHLKKSMETIPNNIELKPWQRKYIQPHDFRWVVGKVLIPTMISLVLVATMLSLNDGMWKLKVEKIGSKIMLNLCMEHEKW